MQPGGDPAAVLFAIREPIISETDMYSIEIELLDLSTAGERYGMNVRLAEVAMESRDCEAVAMESRTWREQRGELVSCPTLFLWLPPGARPELRFLASSQLLAFNHQSADLRQLITCLGVHGSELLVRCNARHLRHFPGEMDTRVFCVVLVAGDTVAVATHRLDEEEMDSMLMGLQACCAGSGPNYRPWRLWSDEEMAQAEGRVEPTQPSVITALAALSDS